MLAADGRKRGSGVLGGVRLTYGLTYGREPNPGGMQRLLASGAGFNLNKF